MSRRHNEEEPIRVDIDEESELESGAPTIDELQAELDRVTAVLDEERKHTADEHDRYLRALADFSNYRRRHQDDSGQSMRFATRELLLKILPIIDNFQRAVAAAEKNHSFDSLADGVKLTLKQFQDVMDREGITTIESVGQDFDPMVHEAVQRVETTDYPDNTVIGEVETGYTHGDHVIRPARVVVAATPES